MASSGRAGGGSVTISIITPWLNNSQLCQMYAKGVTGAEVIVVDNASTGDHPLKIAAMVQRLGGVYIRNETNNLFAKANNQGLEQATGEIVVFLNNDVECRPGFLAQVEKDVRPGALYGPSKLNRHGVDYLEGWCIAAKHDVWLDLGGWDDTYYQGLYWEDNDLCWRAMQKGYQLVETRWPVWHYNNYTTNQTPGAMAHAAANEARFLERISQR
jgi:O-antigen biosynthesis protein